jgi:galactokinase
VRARSAGAQALAAWFAARYGRPAEVVWRAPGRVNLIGEHTDYNNGLVLPLAVARSVLAAAAPRPDGLLEFCSRQRPADPVSAHLDQLEPRSVPGWAAYPAGVAWALRTTGHRPVGASLAIDSDLPAGAGLASSAALECAAGSALAEVAGLRIPRPEMAGLAWRAENEFVGVPCGIMDQSAAMLCQAGRALLLDCRSGESEAVPFDPGGAGLRLLIIDTRARHALADGDYAARRRQCEEAAQVLGVPSLREVGGADELARLADPLLARRARHVVTENERVVQTAALLRAGRLADSGPLLTASHRSLRDDFEVSWPAADVAVDTVLTAGALGARMTGGGFGGCVLALLPAARADAARAALGAAYAARGWPEPRYLDGEPADGAHRDWLSGP